jgi:quaternary ammonium compound-resistance protein SugE
MPSRRIGTAIEAAEGKEVPNGWIALFLAGLFEIGWALGLKFSDGFTRLWPSVATVAATLLSFAMMAIALRTLPLGTAYAIWTGMGVVGTMIVGMVAFGEASDTFRIACLLLITAGMLGLRITSSV